jgi:hypothetical protein
MLPFSIRCNTCGEYMYVGRKFNSRKELVQGEDYLGIKIWRFYIRCSMCSAEITLKTDPKHGSYICEQGAKRSHELWEKKAREEQLGTGREDEEDKGNDLETTEDVNALMESRQEEALREMNELNALEELREKTADIVDHDLLNHVASQRRVPLAEEDEEMIKETFQLKKLVEEENGIVPSIETLSGSSLTFHSRVKRKKQSPSQSSAKKPVSSLLSCYESSDESQ